ncbi:MAG: HD domain-containing protein [Methylotenera sp.]|nr:HD domain-containing protein [Oligoflexia bacterium]
MPSNLNSISVLMIGTSLPAAVKTLEALLPPNQILARPCDLEALMEETFTLVPAIILCSQPPEGISLIEVAQLLRMRFQNSKILFITSQREGFERKSLQKNGFDDAFLMPIDSTVLQEFLKDELAKISQGAIRTFRSVKLMDLEAGEVLDFDTFLFFPMNKKYVKYSASGDSLDKDQTKKLAKHQVGSVHVTVDQMQKVYDFTAGRLKKLGAATGVSETEKRERIQGAVRELMVGLFNDSAKEGTIEQGRAVIADCQGIVKSYITNSGKDSASWYEKLLNLSGSDANSYSHSGNTATYAALFSLGLGIGDPEQLAIAGLLHDIGMVDVPEEIQLKRESEWTEEEKNIFQKHPEFSVSLIKNRNMIVPEIVMKMIMMHHEKVSGGGYPRGLAGPKFLKEAQVLGLANRFDELTALVEGKATLTPKQALDQIKADSLDNPSIASFDPEIVNKLVAMFSQGNPTESPESTL